MYDATSALEMQVLRSYIEIGLILTDYCAFHPYPQAGGRGMIVNRGVICAARSGSVLPMDSPTEMPGTNRQTAR